MYCFDLLPRHAPILWPCSSDSISSLSQLNPFTPFDPYPSSRFHLSQFYHRPTICCGIRDLRQRMESVKNTQKLVESMKLVAAAKVRRAQEAVTSGRPFAETLVQVLCDINEQCQLDDVEIPLTATRPVERVALVVITGDMGLCGSFNSAVLKRAETRIAQLKDLGLDYTVISVGRKGNSYFRNRPKFNVDSYIDGEGFPTSKKAQVIADDLFSLFVSEDVDRVELLYTKFVSFLKSAPVNYTLLPLSKNGENRVDDELFRLTTSEGKLAVVRDHLAGKKNKPMGLLPNIEFEQDPAQILDALMPLYLNSQILRALHESYASELAARMNAMSTATDNAVDLNKSLSTAYNRERQAKITNELLEIIAGAEALK